MPPKTVSTVLAWDTSVLPTAPRSLVTTSCARLRRTAFPHDTPRVIHSPRRVGVSMEAIWRYGASPSVARDARSMMPTEGSETHISNVHGSNFSFVPPVINFCWRATFVDRKALAARQRINPSAEKLISPTVDTAQPITTAMVGTTNHISNGIPNITTNATVNKLVVDPTISVNATEEKPRAMLSQAMEQDAVIAIGTIMHRNSDTVGTRMGVPCCDRAFSNTATQIKLPQMKCNMVTNLGNLKAYSTKTHFTVSFIVESDIKYTMTLATTFQPRPPKMTTITHVMRPKVRG
mmetsp:Transcript_65119/g.187381  ORF Transcript_65119/g.187381 Transcript_65119/m.187381 type:complete len:292 (+) Transcript_65119:349-1224(+)